MGFSRFLASLILGSGILAPEWSCHGIIFSKYHSLFLFYGCAVTMTCILLVLVPAIVGSVKRHPEAACPAPGHRTPRPTL
jgi:hypothetical protein